MHWRFPCPALAVCRIYRDISGYNIEFLNDRLGTRI